MICYSVFIVDLLSIKYFWVDICNCSNYSNVTDGYGTSDMMYFWTYGEGKSIKMAPDVRLSQFDLEGFPQANQTMYKPGGRPTS